MSALVVGLLGAAPGAAGGAVVGAAVAGGAAPFGYGAAAPAGVPAVALPAGGAGRALAVAPECGDDSDTDFPIGTTLHAGPRTYHAGAGWRHWRVELRNTTRVACRAIHPVALFADQGRALRPRQVRVQFHDPYQRRWRPVRFEATDQDENVGVFDGGSHRQVPRFKGFEVPARGEVTVRVRVRFTADAPVGPASAAVTAMQRQHQDGDWVGQSGTYRFTIAPPRGGDGGRTGSGAGRPDVAGPRPEADAATPGPDRGTGAWSTPDTDRRAGAGSGVTGGTGPDRGGDAGTATDTGTDVGAGRDAGDAAGADPNGVGGAADGPGAGTADGPGAGTAEGPPQLAATGAAPPWGFAACVLGLLLGGVTLVARARRFPRRLRCRAPGPRR